MRRSYVFCIAALLASAAALPAAAQNAQPQARVVPYGDLNLDSSPGAHVMVRRIEQASRAVCGDRAGTRSLTENSSVNNCRVDSTENAVTDLDHPMVTAEYYGDNGGNVIVTEDAAPIYDDNGAPIYDDGGSKGY